MASTRFDKQRLNILLGILILLIFLASWEAVRSAFPGFIADDHITTPAKQLPDLYLSGVTTHQYSKTGNLP